MDQTIRKLSFAAAAILTLLASTPAFAGVSFARLVFRQNTLLVSLDSDSTNSVDIERIVNDGLSLKVVYHLTLYRKRAFPSSDQVVTNFQLLTLSKRDVINNGIETEVHFGTDSRGRWFPGSAEMSRYLMAVRDLRVLKTAGLDPQGVYTLEARQDITSLDIQPPLSFIYSLFGRWNYSSGRVRSRSFTRNGILNE